MFLIPEMARRPIRACWRWRWVMLRTAWVVAVCGWMGVATLPDQYQAATRIYVETENLLVPLLRNIAIQADVQSHVEVMQRTLLNRNNVIHVLQEVGLSASGATEIQREEAYLALQRSVTVTAEGRNLFSVSYRNRSPETARKVVESLLAIFVDSTLGRNRSKMEGARAFIETQIAEYETQLKQAELRLADYKGKHAEVLTAIGTNFAARMEAAREEESAARIKVQEITATRDQLHQSLGQVPEYVSTESSPQVMVGNSGSPQARIIQMEAELAALRARYTDAHPDVVAASRALALARADLGGQASRPVASRIQTPNVVHQQLKLRLVQAESELATARSRHQVATETLKRLAGMGEVAPRIEAELADLNREYGVLKGKYEDLLNRRESARISEAAESSGDKVQFRVIEEPHVLARPAAPNRLLLNSGVLAVALLAAAGMGFLMHRIDDSVHSRETLSEEFGVRVLGALPVIEGYRRAKRQHWRGFAAASAGLFAVYLAMVAISQTGWLARALKGIF
ncbi:MAG TPA: XrtA system polysaccharide chain length determinant [Magnetospirillum sp.]|jgi:polysaccharide chain length determinant protein (PEP-CTERM system associated)|nr:XrtA system polysaccharide chain length determinant [Magnetospirillum sp.]